MAVTPAHSPLEDRFDNPQALSKSALQWIVAAGLFAIAVSAFVIWSDYKLSHSNTEKILGATLLELRTAQASLPSRVTDPRQLEGAIPRAASQAGAASGVPLTVIKKGNE